MSKKRYIVVPAVVVAAVALSIVLFAATANHQPVITSLKADPEMVSPAGSCRVMCDATHPDNDELSYGWSASGGGVTGEGATVTWTAPDAAGSYDVTVMVSDSRGASVTKRVTIIVRANNPPLINSLTVDAYWTTPSGSVQVTCDAIDADGDELSYAWSTDGGDISGTGAVVTWTAPETRGNYIVLVEVRDGYGGRVTQRIHIDVYSLDDGDTANDECPPNALQAANTELHKAQTAIIWAMADAERGRLTTPSAGTTAQWSGEPGVITIVVGSVTYDAADYVDEPFKATYTVGDSGHILGGTCDGIGQWGPCVVWNPATHCWNRA